MTKKTKIWKTTNMLIFSLTFLMMTAASVNAERTEDEVIPRTDETPVDDSLSSASTDDLLISPSPESILINPGTDVIYEEVPVDDNTSNDLTDDLVISPNLEPPLIAPNSDAINEGVGETDNLVISGKTVEHLEISTVPIPAFVIIAVIVGIAVSIVLIKRK